MAINVQGIYLSRVKLPFLYSSAREGGLYDLINVLGPFSVTLQPLNFCKIEFTYFSSGRKTARKIKNILQSSCFQLGFESFKSGQYP